MTCQIKRTKNDVKVFAPNGEESILFKTILDNIAGFVQDETIDFLFNNKDILAKEGKELALGLWSKVYNNDFIDWFSNSKMVDRNGEPLLMKDDKGNLSFIKAEKVFKDDKELKGISWDKQKVEIGISNSRQIKPLFNEMKPTVPALYQSQEKSSSTERLKSLDVDVKASLLKLLDKLGVDIKLIKDVETNFKLDGVTAFVDLGKRVIGIRENTDSSVISEEISHVALAAMGKSARKSRAMELVVDTEIYRSNYEIYYAKYKELYPKLSKRQLENKVKEEVLGKMLAEVINSDVKSRLHQILRTLWNKFMNLLGNNKAEINLFIDTVASDINKGDLSAFEQINDDSIWFNLDPKAYKNSKLLDGFKKELQKIHDTRIHKFEIFSKQGSQKFRDEQRKLLNETAKDIRKNRTTVGLIRLINHLRTEANQAYGRALTLENHPLKHRAQSLNHIFKYIVAYEPMLKEIQSELSFMEVEGKSKVMHEVKELLSTIGILETKYYNESRKIIAETLLPFAEGNENIKNEEDLVKLLESAPKDITYFRRWLNSMADSGDDILALTDQLVKKFKEKARVVGQQKIQKLLNLDKEADKDWMVERDSDGNVTGNYIREFNYGDYERDLKRAQDGFRKKFGIGKDQELDKVHPGRRKKYNRATARWIAANSQTNPKYKELIEAKARNILAKYMPEVTEEQVSVLMNRVLGKQTSKLYGGKFNIKLINFNHKSLDRKFLKSEEHFSEWYGNTASFSKYTKGFIYKNELSVPSDKYKNSSFTLIQNNPSRKAYYDEVVNLLTTLSKQMPDFFQKPGRLPQIRKDTFERAMGDLKGTLKESFNDLKSREDDTDFGMKDERGIPVHFLPIYYTRKLKNMSDLSLNISGTVALYVNMAENYNSMSEITDILELNNEVLAKRIIEIPKGGKISKIKELAGLKTVQPDAGGKAYQRYKDYMSMVVYGKQKLEEKALDGIGLNAAKVADAFNKYTAIQGLGFNVYSALANPILGNAMTIQEAVTGEFFNKKHLGEAVKFYGQHLGSLLGDVNKESSNNLLRGILEQMDLLDDYGSRTADIKTDRKAYQRMFSTSSLFILSHAGEHQIQSTSALALLHSKEKEGKKLMDELYMNDENILSLKDNSPFTQADLNKYSLEAKKINQKLNGIYNDVDKSAVQKFALGRMALIFRKFIKPGFDRRWESKRFDYQLNVEVEGMYTSTINFMANLYKDLEIAKFSLQKNSEIIKGKWANLSQREKYNMTRTAIEVGYLLGATVLGYILMNMADDDEDNWTLNMLAYQTNRFYTEVRFNSSIGDAMKIMKSPAAGVNQIQTIMDFMTKTFSPIDFALNDEPLFTEYKSGRKKGETYLKHLGKKLIPLSSNIEKSLFPEEQLKYFSN